MNLFMKAALFQLNKKLVLAHGHILLVIAGGYFSLAFSAYSE